MYYTKKYSLLLISGVILLCIINLSSCGEHSHKHNSRDHSFSNIEWYASVFESPERAKWQKPDLVVKRMRLKTGDVVADIGAGTGYFTRRFAVTVAPKGNATGYDVEPAMVKYMKDDAKKLDIANYYASLINRDLPNLPKNHFDVIFFCDSYHHIHQRKEYFIHLKPSLKADGRLIIVDFYKKEAPIGPPLEHKMSKTQVIRELKLAGYRLRKDSSFLPYQYYLEFTTE